MNTFILNGWHKNMRGRKLFCEFAGWGGYKFHFPLPYQQYASVKFFPEQVRWADSIFFSGGDTPTLLGKLMQAGEWQAELKDKTIVAVSAGISALATFSFNIDHKIILPGMGLLPFKTIVHYYPGMEWMAEQLAEVRPDLPILLIPDDTYIIIRR